DPEREMAHWREALDEAWSVLRTIDTPRLPAMWRHMQQIKGTAARSSWPYLHAIEDFIPWDITYEAHYPVNLPIPQQTLQTARQQWPGAELDVVFRPHHQLKWRTWAHPYHSAINDASFEAHLPLGSYTCSINHAFGSPPLEIGEIEVTPDRAGYIQQPSG